MSKKMKTKQKIKDLETVLTAERPKGILLVAPTNPRMLEFSAEEQAKFNDICRKRKIGFDFISSDDFNDLRRGLSYPLSRNHLLNGIRSEFDTGIFYCHFYSIIEAKKSCEKGKLYVRIIELYSNYKEAISNLRDFFDKKVYVAFRNDDDSVERNLKAIEEYETALGISFKGKIIGVPPSYSYHRF